MVNLNLLVAFFVSTPTDRCLDPRQEQGAFPVTPERLGKLGNQSKFRTSGLSELELTEFYKTLDECDECDNHSICRPFFVLTVQLPRRGDIGGS